MGVFMYRRITGYQTRPTHYSVRRGDKLVQDGLCFSFLLYVDQANLA